MQLDSRDNSVSDTHGKYNSDEFSAHMHIHTHTKHTQNSNLILLVSSNVANLYSEAGYTSSVAMAPAWHDCDHTISRGSWEISLRERVLWRKRRWTETEREKGGGQSGKGSRADTTNQSNLLSAAMWINYLTLPVCHTQ